MEGEVTATDLNDHSKLIEPQASRPGQGPLTPHPCVQKFLISSTCRFTGEYRGEGLLVAHAWPGLRNRAEHVRQFVGAGTRNALMLVFRTDPNDHGDIVIPNYEHASDVVCSYLSLLYGKRFDSHGAVESSGLFSFPDLRGYELFCDPSLPQNTHTPRADVAMPLELAEIHRLIPLLFGQVARSQPATAFRGACKFYLQALQAAEHDIEVAYLHLITAGEILAAAVEPAAESLLDAQTRALLVRFENEMPDGARVARTIRSKLRSIKRQFVVAIDSLVDPSFFERSEAAHQYARLKASSFVKVLAAAYDLRSIYLHTGKSFGTWIAPRGLDNEELQTGRPIVDDKKYGRMLAAAPTYVGLERIVRYALLKFAENLGVNITQEASQPS